MKWLIVGLLIVFLVNLGLIVQLSTRLDRAERNIANSWAYSETLHGYLNPPIPEPKLEGIK